MLYAKVVLDLALNKPFDYIVPQSLEKKALCGKRVWVDFRSRRACGFITELSSESSIANLKPILEIIDENPLLDECYLRLTREVAAYYSASYGEVIATSLPDKIRKGSFRLKETPLSPQVKPEIATQKILLHNIYLNKRWNFYLDKIKEVILKNGQVIVLMPDVKSVFRFKDFIVNNLNAVCLGLLLRKDPMEAEVWEKVRSGKLQVILGTRSAIFACAPLLSLIIIDEEEDEVYKQEQSPHYHAREVGLMRSELDKVDLILGSAAPSLESYYLAKKEKIKYIPWSLSPDGELPQISLISLKNAGYGARQRAAIFTKYLSDMLALGLEHKEKSLLFLNRKGYSTVSFCMSCSKVLQCPRCSTNLTYYFEENKLRCQYCSFSEDAPKICPDCNSGYIKFSGLGVEKIENELARTFPQAKIILWGDEAAHKREDADIFIGSRAVLRKADFSFDISGALGIDNSLNRVDFRAGEKTFALLCGLLALTKKKMIIQTYLDSHHCFQALQKNDLQLFYEKELAQRKDAQFPPFVHLVLIKIRGKHLEKVKEVSLKLFEKLSAVKTAKKLELISVNESNPAKKRGNFYWQILLKSNDVKKAGVFIKNSLENFRHSGIIVTIDVDPI